MLFIVFSLLSLLFLLAQPVQAQVIINELMPAPSQGQEWIELFYPPTTNQTQAKISLSNWSLWDLETSSSKIFTLTDQEINPGEYLTIAVTNKLNNSQDGVILKNEAQQIVDQVNYHTSQTDLSWMRIPQTSDFIWSQPSKNLANPEPTAQLTAPPSPTKSQIKKNSPTATQIKDPPTQIISPTVSKAQKTNLTYLGKIDYQQLVKISQNYLNSPSLTPTSKLSPTATTSNKIKQSIKSNNEKKTQECLKKGLISVIIGGTCLFALGGYYLYLELTQHENHP